MRAQRNFEYVVTAVVVAVWVALLINFVASVACQWPWFVSVTLGWLTFVGSFFVYAMVKISIDNYRRL